MNRLRAKKYFTIAALLSAAVLYFSDPAFAQEKILTVIGNSSGVPDQMNMEELKKVMRGEKQRWNNSTPVIIALMKSTTETGMVTSKRIFEMNPDEFNKFWLALVFQGKVKAPVFFHSASELETFVSETPGAIGIVETSTSEKVKKIAIDGKKSL